MGVVEDLGDALAEEALAAADKLDDVNLVDELSEVIGAGSQTLQEAFMTAVRVRRAEVRGRGFLREKLRKSADRDAEQAG